MGEIPVPALLPVRVAPFAVMLLISAVILVCVSPLNVPDAVEFREYRPVDSPNGRRILPILMPFLLSE